MDHPLYITVSGKPCSAEDEMSLPETVRESLRKLGGYGKIKIDTDRQPFYQSVSGIMGALSDPLRVRLLYALTHADLCPCVLKEILEISDSKLSYHLGILEREGLVSVTHEKYWRIYSITSFGKSVLRCIEELVLKWNDRKISGSP